MQVQPSTIQVHVLPTKPNLQLQESDRDVAGVYCIEVDSQDYPVQHATAALNALRQAVSIISPADFELHVYDSTKGVWLLPPEGEVDFPSDGVFTGKIDVPIIPLGTKLSGMRDEIDHDDADAERVSPAGSYWTVREIDRASMCLINEANGAHIYASVCQVGTDFRIHKGYEGEQELSVDDLEAKYSPAGGGEHSLYTRMMWREAVANEDTISGYWAWVVSEIEQAGLMMH